MAKKNKRPGQRERVENNKKPRNIENPNSWLSKTPSWVFSKHDFQHSNWSLKCCDDLFEDIILKLKSFEGMTWDAINKQKHSKEGKSSNHFVKVNDLTKEAQKRIQELGIFDDEVYSLRLKGKLRLYGIINDGIFNIIWYDKEHKIYPSAKKHT